MALSYNIQTSKSISLEDFINKINLIVNPNEPKTLIECVEYSHMLSNNREFLAKFLNNQLENFVDFQGNNNRSAQTITLYSNDNFYLRVNAWPKIKSSNGWENNLYRTLQAHDHNFDFLTVGYLGEGYETEIWEYDYEKVGGYEGEKVDLKYLETTKLPKGKVMIYRASKDVHAQFPAEEYSVSINIMPNNKKVLKREQFWFTLDKKEIKSVAENVGTCRYLLFNLAKNMGNDKTLNLIEKISINHKIPYVKVRAIETLSSLIKDKSIWKKYTDDSNPMLRNHARLFLENKISF